MLLEVKNLRMEVKNLRIAFRRADGAHGRRLTERKEDVD